LEDILAAIRAIYSYRPSGPLTEGLVFDAIRMRLVEIGEAAADLPDQVRRAEPEIAWRQIVALRNLLTHRYCDTLIPEVTLVVDHDLAQLEAAAIRLLASDANSQTDEA